LSKTLKPANIPLNERAYAGVFTLGLVIAGVVGSKFYSDAFETWEDVPMATLALAGILVGFGSQLGNGCTSGHGICGISSFRIRSLVATCTFMATGVITSIVLDTQKYLPHFENTLSVHEGGLLALYTIVACVLLLPAAHVLPAHDNCQSVFRLLSEFVTGFAFAAGLIISNMTRCSATISFLDLRYWNPALMFVMAAAIAITAASYQYMFNQGKPLLGDEFQLSKVYFHFPVLLTHSFIHSFIHSFTHSFIHSFIHSFTHTLIHSFIHSLIHSYIHSYIHSFIHLPTHSFIHSFTHPPDVEQVISNTTPPNTTLRDSTPPPS
jgi:uncharacterized membrane protein YedE/YeeE